MPRAPRRRATTVLWEGRRRITVATLPGRGLYVRHLTNPDGVDAVHRPTVGLPGAPARSGAFSRAWLRAGLAGTDVVHVVGLRADQDPDDVQAAVDLVRSTGTPLVVTGYALGDPTTPEGARTRSQLDVLVPAADAVVTLTHEAAQTMRRNWDVDPLVLPHPHVVNFVRMRQGRPPRRTGRGRLRAGVHLGSLRPGQDPVELVTAMSEAARAVGDVDVVVHAHRTVGDAGALTYARDAVTRIEALTAAAGGGLVLHDRLGDNQLWDHLSSLDVSVVPGLSGTHSIWPEACADLGTWAVVPQDSPAAAQRSCLVYDRSNGVEGMIDGLVAAFEAARHTPAPRSDTEERWAERVRIAEALRATYERLLGLNTGRTLKYTA